MLNNFKLALVLPFMFSGWGPATAYESYRRGEAYLTNALGNFAVNMGSYYNYIEEVKTKNLQNQKLRHDIYWSIRESYRNKIKRPTFIESETQRLDNAEKLHELRQRENDLIARGILPSKQPPAIVHNGVKYKNMDDFKKYGAYYDMLDEASYREMDRIIKKVEDEINYNELIQKTRRIREFQSGFRTWYR